MPSIRLLFLWHMHQPFYKDLVGGHYRLPWVRMHALKDYYGMVKLLDEFPAVHQTFNLVPSLIAQIEDYVKGTALDPFMEVAAKPAANLTPQEKRFALQHLFQANVNNLIFRYPRYRELYEKFSNNNFEPNKAALDFNTQEFTDLQVLSQLAWFDEFFLDQADPELKSILEKGREFSTSDQKFVLQRGQEIVAAVLPAYKTAAQRGSIELSTSPYYHPILPLLCDTDVGRVSSPGLPLPQKRFQYPHDAAEQLRRGLDLCERVFGIRPCGVWPSEGSVSEEVLAIAAKLGVEWMATDEGVLGRSIGAYFGRTGEGILHPESAETLYRIFRYEKDSNQMNIVFRDHSLSDLIGFVYAGMPANEAAQHFIHQLKKSAQPVLDRGKDATVSVILDGENAWESFPKSGREFLRRLYELVEKDPQIDAMTVSEAGTRTNPPEMGTINHLVPGSWINSNFNVWIGAPEDNRAWDYLTAARELYDRRSARVSPAERSLAFEELLIAEGSDWNWWYGPEHSSANDPDFDDLYRKHLSNVYLALRETPPDYLAQPIIPARVKTGFTEQTAYVHPVMDGTNIGFFDWIGAAHYVADGRDAAMHGKRFLLRSGYAGIDEDYLYCRLDFTDDAFVDGHLAGDFDITMTVECIGAEGSPKLGPVRLTTVVKNGKKVGWNLDPMSDPRRGNNQPKASVCLHKVLEIKLSLDYLLARIGDTLEIRFSIWQNKLPIDALPSEGAIRLRVLSEEGLRFETTGENWKA